MKILLRALRDLLSPMRVSQPDGPANIEPGAVFEYPRNVEVGQDARIARQAILRANTKTAPGIRIGARTLVLENVLINANEGHVSVGKDSWLGPFTLIYGNGGVDIGDNVLIAAHSSINTVSHHAERTEVPINEQGIYLDPVVIEDDVWLGLNVSVLQGVRIGKGSIIGAGAVVTRDIPPYSIAVGIPAKVIRSRRDTDQPPRT